MIKPVVLDSGPLGKLAHPRVNKDIKLWFETFLKNGNIVIIPEIADYEVRRSLIHANLLKSIERLNELKEILLYLPINTEAIFLQQGDNQISPEQVIKLYHFDFPVEPPEVFLPHHVLFPEFPKQSCPEPQGPEYLLKLQDRPLPVIFQCEFLLSFP